MNYKGAHYLSFWWTGGLFLQPYVIGQCAPHSLSQISKNCQFIQVLFAKNEI